MNQVPGRRQRVQRKTLLSKLVRFPIIGLVNSLVYSFAAAIYISHWKLDSQIAAFLAYLTALPIAFLGHRRFTFDSSGVLGVEMRRFVCVHVLGLLVSWLGMSVAVDVFGWHYAAGILAAVVLVPAITFLAFDRWVFRSPTHPGDADGIARP